MIMNDGEESDQVLMVDGRGSLTTHLLIEKAPYWRASSVVLIKTGLTLHMRHFGIFPRPLRHRNQAVC